MRFRRTEEIVATFRVRWEIDIEADLPEDAARRALEIQHDGESTTTTFTVDGQLLDLRYRCNLCGDVFDANELRRHLRAHSPAADSALETSEVEQFSTWIS